MDEDTTCTTDEMLDYLCWHYAVTAERFYPPKETADECMESVRSNYLDRETTDAMTMLAFLHSHGWEEGQHSRAWLDAQEFFEYLERRGFDPKARAERELQRSRENGQDLPDLDWSWYES